MAPAACERTWRSRDALQKLTLGRHLRPTSFMSATMGAGLGAAAGGLGVFMLCNAKCPGGVKGAGILGAFHMP